MKARHVSAIALAIALAVAGCSNSPASRSDVGNPESSGSTRGIRPAPDTEDTTATKPAVITNYGIDDCPNPTPVESNEVIPCINGITTYEIDGQRIDFYEGHGSFAHLQLTIVPELLNPS